MVRWGTPFVGVGCCRIGGLGRAVMVSCFYWVVERGILDGQVSVDDVDREFWQLLVN